MEDEKVLIEKVEMLRTKALHPKGERRENGWWTITLTLFISSDCHKSLSLKSKSLLSNLIDLI